MAEREVDGEDATILYFLKLDGHRDVQPFKVGITSDLDQRIAALQTGNPYKLQLYISFQCKSENEARLIEARTKNEVLGRKLGRGEEWGTIKRSDLDKYIKELKKILAVYRKGVFV